MGLFIWLHQDSNILYWYFLCAWLLSQGNRTISFSSSNTVLSTGLRNIWDLSTLNFTVQTIPLLPVSQLMSLAMGQWLRSLTSVFNSTISPTVTLRLDLLHFDRAWSEVRNSFLNWLQNSFAMCWILLHLLLL